MCVCVCVRTHLIWKKLKSFDVIFFPVYISCCVGSHDIKCVYVCLCGVVTNTSRTIQKNFFSSTKAITSSLKYVDHHTKSNWLKFNQLALAEQKFLFKIFAIPWSWNSIDIVPKLTYFIDLRLRMLVCFFFFCNSIKLQFQTLMMPFSDDFISIFFSVVLIFHHVNTNSVLFIPFIGACIALMAHLTVCDEMKIDSLNVCIFWGIMLVRPLKFILFQYFASTFFSFSNKIFWLTFFFLRWMKGNESKRYFVCDFFFFLSFVCLRAMIDSPTVEWRVFSSSSRHQLSISIAKAARRKKIY